MTVQEFLNHMNSGAPVKAGSPVHRAMCALSQEALRLTAELNNAYRSPEEIREIFPRIKTARDGWSMELGFDEE